MPVRVQLANVIRKLGQLRPTETGTVTSDPAASRVFTNREIAKASSLAKKIPVTDNNFSLYASSIGIPEVLQAGLHIEPKLNQEQIEEIDSVFMKRLLKVDGAVVDLASGNSDTAIKINEAAGETKAYRIDPAFSSLKKINDFDESRDKVGSVFNIPMLNESVGFLICKGLCDYMNEPLLVNIDGEDIDINEQMARISDLGFRAVEALKQKKMNTFTARNQAYERLQRQYRPYYSNLKLNFSDLKKFLDEAYRVMKPGAELRIFSFSPEALVSFQTQESGDIDKVANDKRMNQFKSIVSRFSDLKWYQQVYFKEAYEHALSPEALDYLDSISHEHGQEINGSLLVLKK